MTGVARKAFGLGLIAAGFGTFFVMDQATLVLNASKSLPQNAFLIFDYPSQIRRGSVVAFDMPRILKDRYEDALFVKVVAGLPGDMIRRNHEGAPCINDACFPVQIVNDKPVADAIPEGRIPPGHYAVFGTAQNSLDSRYAVIGLMPESTLRGTGFAIPFPQWQRVAGWF